MNEIEKNLINKCKEGNIEAFETLIYSYEKKAYNVAYRILNHEEDAKDATQEAFVKVYKNMRNFKEESSFSTWLYRIVTNTCLDWLRKKKHEQVQSLDEVYEGENGNVHIELAIDYHTPETIYGEKEKKELVIKAIEELGEEYKTVIVLREIEGFSYDEIAKILECSIGTVKSRINRGRNILKSKLTASLELSRGENV